MSSDKDNNTIC